jgi:hypothetical protein
MATDEGQQVIGGISRRSLLRGGLLAGAGLATIGTASAALTGTARASTPNPQYGWYFCIYCNSMFFGDDAGVCISPGSPDGRHWEGVGNYNYGIANSDPEATGTSNPQGDWYWCPDCVCLFWGQSGSVCAGNQNPITLTYRNHAIGGTNYILNFGPTDITNVQGGWHWCILCHNLFWPGASSGFCTACRNDPSLPINHQGGGTSYDVAWIPSTD